MNANKPTAPQSAAIALMNTAGGVAHPAGWRGAPLPGVAINHNTLKGLVKAGLAVMVLHPLPTPNGGTFNAVTYKLA